MEAAIGNVVEPGDTMLVPTNGYFGGRMRSMAERAGGEVVEVDALGETLERLGADVDAEAGRTATLDAL